MTQAEFEREVAQTTVSHARRFVAVVSVCS